MIAAGIGIIASAAVLLFIYFEFNRKIGFVVLLVGSLVIYFVFERACSLVHPYLGSFVLPLLIMCALYLTLFFVDPYDVTELEVREEKITWLPVLTMVIMVAIYIIFTAIFTGIKVPANLVNPIWTNAFIYIGVFLGLVVVVILHFFNRYAIFLAWIIWAIFTTVAYQFGMSALLNGNSGLLYYLMYLTIGFANIVSIYFHHDGRKTFEDKTHIRVLKWYRLS